MVPVAGTFKYRKGTRVVVFGVFTDDSFVEGPRCGTGCSTTRAIEPGEPVRSVEFGETETLVTVTDDILFDRVTGSALSAFRFDGVIRTDQVLGGHFAVGKKQEVPSVDVTRLPFEFSPVILNALVNHRKDLEVENVVSDLHPRGIGETEVEDDILIRHFYVHGSGFITNPTTNTGKKSKLIYTGSIFLITKTNPITVVGGS